MTKRINRWIAAMNRRDVLMSSPAVAAGAGLGALATCGPNGIQIDPAVLTAIQNAVAQGCNFIPAVTTIIPIIDNAFPAVNGATTIAESVLAQISSLLCGHVTSATASGKLGGSTVKAGSADVPVHGWTIVNGKLTYV